MIDLLEFALRDGWTFAGCAGLLLLVGLIFWAISCALALARPLQGIVQVYAPSDSHNWSSSNDRNESLLSLSPSSYLSSEIEAAQETPIDCGDENPVHTETHQHGLSNSAKFEQPSILNPQPSTLNPRPS